MTDNCQQSNKNENLEESFFEEKQSRHESICVTRDDYLSNDSAIYSDDEGDTESLNSYEDLIKSSKLIVFQSCLITLFNFYFPCPREDHFLKLRTQGSTVLVNITCENGYENQWCSLSKSSKAKDGNNLLY